MRQLGYIFILLLSFSSFGQNFDLVISNSPPYVDESEANQGFLTELVKESLKAQGVRYNLQFTTKERAHDAINNLDGISLSFIKDKEHEEKWYFSRPIIQAPSIFISHKESDFDINEIDDIKDYRIGITRDLNYGEVFEKLSPLLELEIVGSDLMNMKKILHKRIDLFPVPLYTAIHYMREYFTLSERANFEFILYPNLTKGNLYLVCHKRNKQCLKFIKEFNKGLERITSAGIKDKIVSNYLSEF